MLISSVQKTQRLCFAFLVAVFISSAVIAQPVISRPVNAQPTPTPFYQPPTVKVTTTAPARPTPTPGVKKTGEITPVNDQSAFDAYALPGYSGALVETMDGKVVKESNSNFAFNPASNVKILTTYATLRTLGPNFRFPTNVWSDGAIDNSGNLIGNLYISGRDPSFQYENAVEIADALNRMNIRSVQGDLIVTDKFVMGFNESTQRSAQMLFATLDAGKRSAAATRSWQTFLASSGKLNQLQSIPSVSFTGGLYVDAMPNNAKMLFAHESAPLREILKVMMAYSNNFMADRLGDYIGGSYAVAAVCQQNAGIPPQEMTLQSSSGLGVNRVTPRAMMRVLRILVKLLEPSKMTLADVMPIAGIDPGTLERRFNDGYSIGSVVGKTGTLGSDGGVSALSGVMNTRKGKLLFVIFNQRGNVPRFRSFQNNYVSSLQAEFGGALSFGYASPNFAVRMSNTRTSYPASRPRN